jgi:hypothetical protein
VPFTEGVAYDDEDWNKVMIIMTDGENDWGSPLTNMNNSYYGGYGYTSQSLTRLGMSFISNRDAVYNERTQVACQKAKEASTDAQKPIVIYTITFGSLASGAGSLMQACATDPDKYFHAPSNAALQTVFTDIATQISDLYLSQ